MATRWMRWNPTSHIFEYSTDGVSFGPLPLNAATINEGTFPSSALPANVVKTDAANVFTSAGPITIQSANPILAFNESDAAVDSKRWIIIVSGSTFFLQTQNDAGVALANILAVARSGAVTLTGVGAVTHGFAFNSNSQTGLSISNTNAGTAAHVIVTLGNNLGSRLNIYATSSAYTPTIYYQSDCAVIVSPGAGGINIAASHASSGDIGLYTGSSSATPALSLAHSGAAVFRAGLSITKISDSLTLTLTKENPSTSGVAQGGISFSGPGIMNAGIHWLPVAGGLSRLIISAGGSGDPALMSDKLSQFICRAVIVNGGVNALPHSGGSFLLVITSVEDNRPGLFLCSPGGVLEIGDPSNIYTGVVGTATSTNVYYSSGVNVQNMRGSTRTYIMAMFGWMV